MEGLLENEQAAEKQEPMPAEDQMPEEEGMDPEQDEALKAALAYVNEQLYSKGIAENFAKVVAKGGRTLPKVFAGIAFKIAKAADAKTNGEIAEENLGILGMMTLAEVFEVAQAAGAEVNGEQISAAFKQMVIMFLEEQGMDTDEMAKSFASMKDGEFAQFADAAIAQNEQQGQQPMPQQGQQQAPMGA